MKKWYDEEYEFTVEVTGGKRRITRMILEALPDWFEANPCRVYVMALK